MMLGVIGLGIAIIMIYVMIETYNPEEYQKSKKRMTRKERIEAEEKAKKANQEAWKAEFESEGIDGSTKRIVYKRILLEDIVIYVVSNLQKLVIYKRNFDNTTEKTVIKFTDIIGFELKEDNRTESGIGRAIIGGAIAGSTGAIVGATTRNTYVNNCSVVIYVNNIDCPQYTFDLDAGKESYKLTKEHEFANELSATIKAIIDNNSITQKESQKPNTYDDLSNKVMALAKLRNQGLITEAEFQEKKNILLEKIV